MSYVPAKVREIFQTCRLRPENIADRGRFRLGDRKSGHPFRPCRPERGAGDANRRGTLRGRRPAVSAGLRSLSLPRKIPFAFSFRRKSRRGSRGGSAGSPPSASLDDHDGSGSFFHRKSSGAKPIRSPAGASAAYVRERRKSQGLRGSRPRRFSREAGGSSNAASPRRFREVPAARQGKDAGVFPRFRLIGKGRAGAVRRVADDADGSFTNGSNRESPATGPASGRGTGWG